MSRPALAAALVAGAAAVGAVAATLVVGARLFERTVVPDPYRAGLSYDADRKEAARPPCSVSAGRCEQRVDGAVLSLEIEPRPVKAMARLSFAVAARRGDDPIAGAAGEIALAMPGMYMGENRVALRDLGGGRYRGQGVVVRCPSGRRAWTAEVTLRPREPAGASPLRATFSFETAE